MKYLKYIVFFIAFTSYSQSFTGIVSDTLNNPLESANVIAKPLQEKGSIKFSITDNKGRYKLDLQKEIRASSFKDGIYLVLNSMFYLC